MASLLCGYGLHLDGDRTASSLRALENGNTCASHSVSNQWGSRISERSCSDSNSRWEPRLHYCYQVQGYSGELWVCSLSLVAGSSGPAAGAAGPALRYITDL